MLSYITPLTMNSLILLAVLAVGLVDSTVIPTLGLGQLGRIDGRIVGGREASAHSAPWIVSMQWGYSGVLVHACGGSIVKPNWVITAGHCITEIPDYGDWMLLAGRHSLPARESSEQKRNIDRKKVWVHERYAGEVGPFDISMIWLRQAFVLNDKVAVIPLPEAGRIHTGNTDLFGWGSISMTINPINPNVLQTAQVPIIPNDECKRVLDESPALTSGNPFHETNLCTGPLIGGIASCSGDSGGPLSQNGVLIGVVSWGFLPCGTENAPSVYVRVSAFNEWIEETFKNSSGRSTVNYKLLLLFIGIFSFKYVF